MNRMRSIFFVSLFFFLTSTMYAEQTPDLGATSSFAIFSSHGHVNDTGQSRIDGNVGTNNGTITGFGNIYGEIHKANENTKNAANDLLKIYNLLNKTIPTHSLGPIIGNGETLKAGIYSSKGGLRLKDNLYLDAEGDTNAVFIIHIGKAFSTDAQAKVKLLNSALASKVFWKVDGDVNIGPASFIRGNIIANGDINLSLNDTLEGRAFTTKGAIKVNKLVTFGDLFDIPTVPLDGRLWLLLGAGVLYAGINIKKLKKVQISG